MVEIYVFTSDPVQLNSYLVVGPERALVVDTGAGPAQAGSILAAFRALTDLPLTVVNTHDHWDHFFGNAAFAADGVDDFLASPGFVRDHRASAWIQLEAVPLEHEPDLPTPEDLLVPVTAVDTGETLSLGDCTVEFLPLGGHTESDLVILCEDVALVGDLVEEGAPPQFGDDALPARWAESLETLLALPQPQVFAPGHGQPVDRTFLAAQLGDIAAVAESDSTAEVPSRTAPPFTWVGTGAGSHLPAGVRRLR
ncbi:MBL fold metallo-hydrolase [Brevibacterium sp. CS2]|uniref:MBL fold metallo-hydrolase n=1 Tax=Brevibacterium sp. CS2 TaxID=2575923 RepID=UPI0010C78DBB|nr:MBL fold metallo-hydrolase [Brevibacterium sp. CS2]QCP03986.1 MBL fold metallo-hydrolase [Brevibacterium sp. CS2]